MTQQDKFFAFIQYMKPLIAPEKKEVNKFHYKPIIVDEIAEDEHTFIQEEEENIKQQKLQMVDDAIDYHLQKNPQLKCDFDLFKMCYMKNQSLRTISKNTRIPLTSVFQYIESAEMLIKAYIKNKQQHIK